MYFYAVPNKAYTVQYTEDVASGVWIKLADVPARASLEAVRFRDLNVGKARFYRVITPPANP
jgi:hypothetical protein